MLSNTNGGLDEQHGDDWDSDMEPEDREGIKWKMAEIILIYSGPTPSGPLVFYYNPGPGSFTQYPMVHWMRVYGTEIFQIIFL